ncbi:MAG: cytochrome c [Verrucomicrobiales bacterium]|nr:cytochrome c [Verrucomicrobiales bacterium]
MKDVSNIKTSGAGNFVHTKRTKLSRGSFDCVTYFVLLGMMIGISQPARADDPGELFVKTCASCHGKDGKAQTPAAKKLGVKDLSQSKLTDAQIIERIMEGKRDTQDSSKMPAFKEKLTPEQIKSLVPVVKEFRK